MSSTTDTNPPIKHNPTQCKICNKEYSTSRGLAFHITKMHTIKMIDYYDAHVRQEHNSCLTCGKSTGFISITRGYRKYCSAICTSRNLEGIEKRKTTRAATLINDPTIIEVATIKRSTTYKDNPNIAKQARVKRKATLQANPEIMLSNIEKRAKTYRKNPHIIENREIKRKATLVANPHIMKSLVNKRKQTMDADPSIQKNATKKSLYTRSLPEAKVEIGKNISIALRSYYNRVKDTSATTSCCVYILGHCSLGIIKIGLTSNLSRRIKEIQKHFGTLKILKTVETSYNLAAALEIKMHDYFREHTMVQPSGDGRTEFFSSVITDKAIVMLEEFEASISQE